jgi:hypothetical protein
MIELNPEIVCQIIDRAREFQSQETVELPETPVDISDLDALASFSDEGTDLTFAEVKSAIEDLEPDQQMALLALMWVGRGDFDIDDWPNALQAATTSWNERTAEYLLTTPLLADYLLDALDQHGYSCE